MMPKAGASTVAKKRTQQLKGGYTYKYVDNVLILMPCGNAVQTCRKAGPTKDDGRARVRVQCIAAPVHVSSTSLRPTTCSMGHWWMDRRWGPLPIAWTVMVLTGCNTSHLNTGPVWTIHREPVLLAVSLHTSPKEACPAWLSWGVTLRTWRKRPEEQASGWTLGWWREVCTF